MDDDTSACQTEFAALAIPVSKMPEEKEHYLAASVLFVQGFTGRVPDSTPIVRTVD